MLQEKRSHARVPLQVPVTCELSDGSRVEGMSRDISLGGMFVESASTPRFNTQLSVLVMLPGAPEEFKLPAVVRWSVEDGFGIQFGLLGAKETHLITKLMRR